MPLIQEGSMAIKWPGIDIKKFYTNLILRYRPQVPWLSPLGPKFWCHFFSQTMQEICCFITFFGLLLKIAEFHVSIIGTAVWNAQKIYWFCYKRLLIFPGRIYWFYKWKPRGIGVEKPPNFILFSGWHDGSGIKLMVWIGWIYRYK